MNTTQQESRAGAAPSPYEEAREQKNRMVKKLLWLGYEMGYDSATTPAQREMTKQQRCWANVERWVLSNHCVVRKHIRKLTVEELCRVLTQFEAVHKSFVKEYNRAG